MSKTIIRRALISVSNKEGLAQLAKELNNAGVEIVSTGATAKLISDLNIPVVQVSEVTNFTEILDGRVKTLHPLIHAGILADVRNVDHKKTIDDLKVKPFDLVVVNLYPFTDTVASGAEFDQCIEQIDIGGVALIRAAAKNFENVSVIVSPNDYPELIKNLKQGISRELRLNWSAVAFSHTATYDTLIARWMSRKITPEQDSPSWVGASFTRAEVLRYGENPHQSAALYRGISSEKGIAHAKQLSGKEMSYNNYVDADHARAAVFDHVEPCVAIIKHANPCGIAIDKNLASAFAKALAADKVSAYGGVIATNRKVDKQTAMLINEIFTEVIVAPSFDEDALQILKTKPNLRILQLAGPHMGHRVEWRTITGGVLMQTVDDVEADGDDPGQWKLVAGKEPSDEVISDLEFAWRCVRAPKSNAIVLAKDGGVIGIGMGQVNRVDAAQLAVNRAGLERSKASVAASDAYFPFPDALEVLIKAGVQAVVHPGGSKNDDEVIAVAKKSGITMYLTGVRHFSH
ncbi:MAG: bifunctional phosphoribosylaminoimidazolecarboxamide formyltransferase/IMP cyclohydrolase [Actinomycetota bacterium]